MAHDSDERRRGRATVCCRVRPPDGSVRMTGKFAPFRATAAEGMRDVAVMQAVYESIRTGRAVDVSAVA